MDYTQLTFRSTMTSLDAETDFKVILIPSYYYHCH